jgi:ferredoxin-NADP reductase
MHRVFNAGRRVFISRPTNHFPLVEDASESLLFAGGIGVTPLIAMAHRLHRLGRNFTLHYSAKDLTDAGFLDDLLDAPWAGRVHYHFSNEGTRVDLSKMVPAFATGMHLYVCGSSRYMDAVFAIAKERDWPDANCHREYFTAPETPAWTNHPFKIKLMRSGKVLKVGANQTAVEALVAVGVVLDVKCSDGLCGVCATPLDAAQSDAVQHRDFVLSETDRSRKIILCCSRTAEPDQQIVLDL